MANLGNIINLENDLAKVALIDESGRVSYRQLHEMSNHVAEGLKAKGYNPGDRIALRGMNSIGYIATYLGILKLGAVAILIDPRLDNAKVDEIIQKNNAVELIENPTTIVSVISDFTPFEAEETDPALIIYTAGTTGNQKEVVIPHGHKWLFEQKSNYPTAKQRRSLVVLPLHHIVGLSIVNVTLCGYGTSIILKNFQASGFLKRIAYHRINSAVVTPNILGELIREERLIRRLNLKCLTHIGITSAPIDQSMYQDLKEILPRTYIQNTYTVSEVGYGIFGRHPTTPTPGASVGYPLLGIDYRIVDNILQIRSPSMFTRYNNINTDKITEDGYFITDDKFKTDEHGFYFFQSRA